MTSISTRLISIVLADDHAIVRAGLRALLDSQPDIEVVGEAGSGDEVVELCRQLTPDVAILDISMPVAAWSDPQDLATWISTRILILTVHAEERYLLPV